MAATRKALHRDRNGIKPLPQPRSTGKALVAGWFSWRDHGATAGDVLACEVVCKWLHADGRPFDVASLLPSLPGVDWREVEPAAYSDVIFVCGPVGVKTALPSLLARFAASRHIGVDLTMLDPLAAWNPFDVLIERDSDLASRPDLSFVAEQRHVPVLGIVLVEPYTPEYPTRDRQVEARAAVARLINGREAAVVEIDTRLERNPRGLRTAAEVANLISRMDAVVTTRLHGLVIAIKDGVPALAIDPVSGGAKIAQQAGAIGWPYVGDCRRAPFDRPRRSARRVPDAGGPRPCPRVCDGAVRRVETIRSEFLDALGDRPQ